VVRRCTADSRGDDHGDTDCSMGWPQATSRRHSDSAIFLHSCYVEVFAGAAVLFFMRPPAEVEVLKDVKSTDNGCQHWCCRRTMTARAVQALATSQSLTTRTYGWWVVRSKNCFQSKADRDSILSILALCTLPMEAFLGKTSVGVYPSKGDASEQFNWLIKTDGLLVPLGLW